MQEQQRAILLPEQNRLVASRMIEECCRLAVERLRQFHQKHPDDPGYRLATFQGWLKRRWGEDVGTYIFEQLKQDQLKILGQYCCLTEFAPKMSRSPSPSRSPKAMAAMQTNSPFDCHGPILWPVWVKRPCPSFSHTEPELLVISCHKLDRRCASAGIEHEVELLGWRRYANL